MALQDMELDTLNLHVKKITALLSAVLGASSLYAAPFRRSLPLPYPTTGHSTSSSYSQGLAAFVTLPAVGPPARDRS